jgi:hypothetical protein
MGLCIVNGARRIQWCRNLIGDPDGCERPAAGRPADEITLGGCSGCSGYSGCSGRRTAAPAPPLSETSAAIRSLERTATIDGKPLIAQAAGIPRTPAWLCA